MKGWQCYQVDVNKFKNQIASEKLRTHILIFMMDYNEDRLGLETDIDLETFDDKDFVKMQEEGNNQKEALIQFELLGMNNYIMNIFYFFSLDV